MFLSSFFVRFALPFMWFSCANALALLANVGIPWSAAAETSGRSSPEFPLPPALAEAVAMVLTVHNPLSGTVVLDRFLVLREPHGEGSDLFEEHDSDYNVLSHCGGRFVSVNAIKNMIQQAQPSYGVKYQKLIFEDRVLDDGEQRLASVFPELQNASVLPVERRLTVTLDKSMVEADRDEFLEQLQRTDVSFSVKASTLIWVETNVRLYPFFCSEPELLYQVSRCTARTDDAGHVVKPDVIRIAFRTLLGMLKELTQNPERPLEDVWPQLKRILQEVPRMDIHLYVRFLRQAVALVEARHPSADDVRAMGFAQRLETLEASSEKAVRSCELSRVLAATLPTPV